MDSEKKISNPTTTKRKSNNSSRKKSKKILETKMDIVNTMTPVADKDENENLNMLIVNDETSTFTSEVSSFEKQKSSDIYYTSPIIDSFPAPAPVLVSYKLLSVILKDITIYRINSKEYIIENIIIPILITISYKNPKIFVCNRGEYCNFVKKDDEQEEYSTNISNKKKFTSQIDPTIIQLNQEIYKKDLVSFTSKSIIQDLEEILFRKRQCLTILLLDETDSKMELLTKIEDRLFLFLKTVDSDSEYYTFINGFGNVNFEKDNLRWAMETTYFGPNNGFSNILLREYYILKFKNKQMVTDNELSTELLIDNDKILNLYFQFQNYWKPACTSFLHIILELLSLVEIKEDINSFLQFIYHKLDVFLKVLLRSFNDKSNDNYNKDREERFQMENEKLYVLPNSNLIDENEIVYKCFNNLENHISVFWLCTELKEEKDDKKSLLLAENGKSVKINNNSISQYNKMTKNIFDILNLDNGGGGYKEEKRKTNTFDNNQNDGNSGGGSGGGNKTYRIKTVTANINNIDKNIYQIWFNLLVTSFQNFNNNKEEFIIEFDEELIKSIYKKIYKLNWGFYSFDKQTTFDDEEDQTNYPLIRKSKNSCFYINYKSNIWKYSSDQSQTILYLSFLKDNDIFTSELKSLTLDSDEKNNLLNYFKIIKIKRKTLGYYDNIIYDDPPISNVKYRNISLNYRFLLWNVDNLTFELFANVYEIEDNVKLMKNLFSFIGNFILYNQTTKESNEKFIDYFSSSKILKTYTYKNTPSFLIFLTPVSLSHIQQQQQHKNDSSGSGGFNEQEIGKFLKKNLYINFSFTNNNLNSYTGSTILGEDDKKSAHHNAIQYHKIISSPIFTSQNSQPSSLRSLNSPSSLNTKALALISSTPILSSRSHTNKKTKFTIENKIDSTSFLSPYYKFDYFYIVHLYSKMLSSSLTLNLTSSSNLTQKRVKRSLFRENVDDEKSNAKERENETIMELKMTGKSYISKKYILLESLILFLNVSLQIYIQNIDGPYCIWFNSNDEKTFSTIYFQLIQNQTTNDENNLNDDKRFNFLKFDPKSSTVTKITTKIDHLMNYKKYVFYNQSLITTKPIIIKNPQFIQVNPLLLITWINFKYLCLELNNEDDSEDEDDENTIFWNKSKTSRKNNFSSNEDNEFVYLFQLSNELYKDELRKNNIVDYYFGQYVRIEQYNWPETKEFKKILYNHKKNKEEPALNNFETLVNHFIQKIKQMSEPSKIVISNDSKTDQFINIDKFEYFLQFLKNLNMTKNYDDAFPGSEKYFRIENMIILLHPNIPKTLEDLILTNEFKSMGISDCYYTNILIYSQNPLSIATLASNESLSLGLKNMKKRNASNLIHIEKGVTINFYILRFNYNSTKSSFGSFSLITWIKNDTTNTYIKFKFEITKEKFNDFLSKSFYYIVSSNVF